MASEYLIKGKLVLDVSDASSKLNNITKETKGIETETKKTTGKIGLEWKKVGTKLSSVGKDLTRNLTLPIIGIGIAALKYASDMEEVRSKTQAVFGDSADNVLAWSKTTLDAFGVGEQAALDMASTMGDMGISMGIPNQAAADMATSLAELAGDLSSFHNISVDRANVALKGIYTGETEALKSMGIVMTEANLKQFAEDAGLVYEEMSQAEKVQLRYNFVMEQTATAHGDFAETSGSVANQSKIVKEKLKTLATNLGENLLPIAKDLLEAVSGWLDKFNALPESTQNAVLWGIGIVAAVGPVLTIIGKIITNVDLLSKAFSTGALSLSTLGWVAAALAVVAGIAAIAISIKNDYNTINADAIALKNSMDTLKSNMDSAQRDYDTDKENIIATSELANAYIETLANLEGQGELTEEGQIRYTATVNELKRIMPELNLTINEQTGFIDVGTKALYDNVKAWKANAIGQAILKKQEKEMEAVADAWIALDKAKRNSVEIDKVINSNQIEMDRLYRKTFEALGMTVEEYNKLSDRQKGNLWMEQTQETKDLQIEYIKLRDETNKLRTGQESLNSEIVKAETAYADAEAQVIDTTGVLADYTQEVAKTEGVVITATTTTEENTEALEKQEEAARKVKEAIADMAENVVNDFDKISLKGGKSLTQLTETLLLNATSYNTIINDMSELTRKGVNEEILKYLYDMGEEGYKIIHKLNTGTEKDRLAFIEGLKQAGILGKDGMITNIDDLPDEVKRILGLTEEEADTGGKSVGNSFADGIKTAVANKFEATKTSIVSFVKNLVQAGKDAEKAKSPSKLTAQEIGVPFAQGIGVGIEDGMKDVLKKVKAGTNKLVFGVSLPSPTAINQKSQSAKNTAKTASQIVQNNHFTARTLSPYEQRVQLKRLDNDLAEVFA